MKNKKKIMQLVPMLFFMVIGGTCGILIGSKMDTFLEGEESVWMVIGKLFGLILCMYIACMFQIIIHEGGHLIFGLLTGYHFTSFRIFNFIFVKTEKGIKIKQLSIAGTGGQCLLCPPDLVDGKMPYALYNLGGVICNILSAALFWGCAVLTKEILILHLLFQLISVVGIGYAVVNGIPMRIGTISNDGYNTISLGQNTKAIRAFWVQMKANDLTSKGKRLQEMPEKWFEMPEEKDLTNEMVAAIAVFHCNRLMELKCFEEAREKMEMLLSKDTGLVDLYKGLMRCDLMYISAMLDEHFEEKWYDKNQKKFMKAMKKFPSVIRARYTYELLVSKDAKKAEEMEKFFEKTAKTYPYSSDIQTERELIELAKKKNMAKE